MKKSASRIEFVKVSPLNNKRWLLALDCGHQTWVTAKLRPQRRRIVCPKCLEKVERNLKGAA